MELAVKYAGDVYANRLRSAHQAPAAIVVQRVLTSDIKTQNTNNQQTTEGAHGLDNCSRARDLNVIHRVDAFKCSHQSAHFAGVLNAKLKSAKMGQGGDDGAEKKGLRNLQDGRKVCIVLQVGQLEQHNKGGPLETMAETF